jgi:CDGSH-type Zn-finger protein
VVAGELQPERAGNMPAIGPSSGPIAACAGRWTGLASSYMTPHIAAKVPCKVSVEAGKTYWWCSCGQSSGQPFCDGSHKGSDFRPLAYVAEADGDVWFCQCKHTGNTPRCDGSHKAL